MAAALAAASVGLAQTTSGATFGKVYSQSSGIAGGTPSDIVLDESRHVLYLISNTINQVQIFDYTVGQVIGTIGVCTNPLAGALSMESVPQWLYVTCNGTSSLAQIDLSQNRVAQTIGLPSKPQGVAVGIDGRVLVSMSGTGVVNGVPQGTLSIFDPALTGTQNLLPVQVPALPTTPANLPVPALPPAVTTFTSKLQRTPDGNYIVGVITPTNATTYVFAYEVSSGIVLRNRTTQGTSSVLSVAPDGSRFMAGLTMFDTASLAVIAQENVGNAPFVMANNFNSAQGIGGSVFAPDGKTLYAAFNTQPTTTPASPPNSSTLLVNDPMNLGIRLGIKLPEAIIAKIVIKADGSDAWALSQSGILNLPLGQMYNQPIIAPETTSVFLAMDDCNRGLAQAALKINNIGGGKLTYSVAADTNSAAVVYQQTSGLAPSAITFTMEPGRSGVTRFPGTNLWSGAGTFSGTPFTLTLTSPNAINIPNTIKLYMNYRQADQRGQIFPVPTTRNNNPSGTTSSGTATNEGLQDILLDEARGRLYITNSGYNRIEVFDTANQVFLTPIPVGQLPHQMAMSSDGNTLYVGNTGGESIAMVDLNLQQVVGNVTFPPIPRNGTVTPIFPRSLAMGLFGLQFVMSNGGQWEVVSNNALPRAANTSVIPTTLAGCPNCGMLASPDGAWIVTLSGDGHAYVYNGQADTYITGRLLFPTIQSYYGPIAAANSGAIFTANTLVLSPSLNTMAGAATPTGVAAVTTPRNVVAVAAINDHQILRLTTPVRTSVTATGTDDSRTTLELVDLTAGTDTLAAVAPENPWISVFGTTRTNVQPRQMVVDSTATTAYAITISGLSVIPLGQPAGAPAIAPSNGIVNSTDGSSNIQPGSFITIRGQNLASKAVATTVPPPTVLGGSCVTFGDVSVPLLQTSTGQIQAQVPDTLPAGTQVVEVRSLAFAQDSAPVNITVRPSGTPAKTGNGGTSEKPGDPRRPIQGKQ